MPMFFLEIETPSAKHCDDQGYELADLDAAIAEATASARELWSQGIREGVDRRRWAITICDGTGSVLRVVRFAETVGLD